MIVMGSPVGGSENDNFPLGYLMKITLCILPHEITDIIQMSNASVIMLSFFKFVSKGPISSMIELIKINWSHIFPRLNMNG